MTEPAMTEPAMTEPAMTEPAGQRPMATASDGWMCPLPPASGPVRFARYAFGPNRLGYCGPDEAPELFAQATSGRDDARLRALARQFEGAWPYLELIAATSGRPDALDAAVVQSYWLGGGLLGSVRPRDIGDSIEARFRPRLDPAGWRWLATKPEAGAVPVHAFHVLDVFPRVGLLRSGQTDRALEVMDSCRIRWGRVEARDGDWLVTRTVPLELVDGRLQLGAPRRERVRGWSDGHGFVDDVRPGDIISIHWDWACERLDAPSLAALQRSTRDELAIANLTI